MTEEKSMEDFLSYQFSRVMFLVLSPTMMFFGVIGNTVSFLVFYPKAKAHKDKSAHFYLALLGIADSVSLLASALPGFVGHAAGVDLIYLSGCGWYLFMLYFVTDVSVYVLVCMTAERFITVFFPHQATTWCNRRKAVLTVILVSLVLVAVNVHLVFTVETRVDTAILDSNVTQATGYCADSEDHVIWKKFVWPWVDMSVLSFIPFIVFVSLNGSIVLRMSHYARKVHAEATIPEQRLYRQRKMNMLVACICVVFLLTTGPITILHIVEPYWNRDDPEQKAHHSLTVAFLGHLGYLTNCVNFALYYFRGSNFKRDLKNVLKNRSKIPTMTLANR